MQQPDPVPTSRPIENIVSPRTRRSPGRPARGTVGRRATRSLGLTLLVATVALLALSMTGHATHSVVTQGEPAHMVDAMGVVMDAPTFATADLDGDGWEEILLLGSDGVMQLYDAQGKIRWATSLVTLVEDDTHQLGMSKSRFLADHEGSDSFATTNSHGFADVNGDGTLDIISIGFVRSDVPVAGWHGVVVTVDGSDGSRILAEHFGGLVAHLIVDDLDGDGDLERLVVEEDGAVGSQSNHLGTLTWGSDGTTTITVTDIATGTVQWTWDSARGWGKVTAVTTGSLASEHRVAVAISGAQDGIYTSYSGTDPTPGQDLVVFDATSGAQVWSTPVSTFAREMLLIDLDQDGSQDVVLRTLEAHGEERGDMRSGVTAYAGADGTTLWDTTGALGAAPKVHDLDALETSNGVPRIVAAVSHDPSTTSLYHEAETSEILLLSPSTGNILSRAIFGGYLNTAQITDTFDLQSPVGPGETVPTPAEATATPTAGKARIIVDDVDGDGNHDILFRDNRGFGRMAYDPTGLEPVWYHEDRVAPQVFFLHESPDPATGTGDLRVHTLGAIIRDSTGFLLSWEDAFRLRPFDAADGSGKPKVPLVSTMIGGIRADLDGDGIGDRIVGGTSYTVFAFRGGTTGLLWQSTVGFTVIDVHAEEVTGDGVPDVLVRGQYEVAGIDGADGTLLWTAKIPNAHDGGEIRATEVADVTNDGVSDLVVGYKPGSQGSLSFHRSGQILAYDGRSGELHWLAAFGVNHGIQDIALGDYDGDGDLDVAASLTMGITRYYGAVVVDGASGAVQWLHGREVAPGGHVGQQENIVAVDWDGDGRTEVAVLGQGRFDVPPHVIIHDGDTGDILARHDVPFSDTHSPHGLALRHGAAGPGGEPAFVVFTYESTAGAGHSTVTTLLHNGSVHYQAIFVEAGGRLGPAIHDYELGDLNGDGVDDPVAAFSPGWTAIDGARSSGDGVTILGHLLQHNSNAISLNDIDGDGKMEVESLTSRGDFPVNLGNWFSNTLAGPPTMVSTSSFAHVDVTDPNLPPIVDIIVADGPIIQSQPHSFSASSSDPDGTVVQHIWSFSDGTMLEGDEVTHTFDAAGATSVTLRAIDDDGAGSSKKVDLHVEPLYASQMSFSKSGIATKPEESRAVAATIVNSGHAADNFTVNARGPAGWEVTATPAIVHLEPGESQTITVNLTLDEFMSAGWIGLTSISDESGQRHTRSLLVSMPVISKVQFHDPDAKYGPLDEVSGTYTATWYDGTPLEDGFVVQVSNVANGRETNGRGYLTDANGSFEFVVPRNAIVGHTVGTHYASFRGAVTTPYPIFVDQRFDVTLI